MAYTEPIRDRPGAPLGSQTSPAKRGWLRSAWSALVGAIGAMVGIAPHVLHHVGFLAGAGIVAGARGTALFGVLGLVASVPFLLRLHRRFGTWWAPVIALAVFTVMFSISSFVIGPAISGDAPEPPGGKQPIPTEDHTGHHAPS